MTHLIFIFRGQDRPDIMAAVSGFIASHRGNSLESAQFGDAEQAIDPAQLM